MRHGRSSFGVKAVAGGGGGYEHFGETNQSLLPTELVRCFSKPWDRAKSHRYSSSNANPHRAACGK